MFVKIVNFDGSTEDTIECKDYSIDRKKEGIELSWDKYHGGPGVDISLLLDTENGVRIFVMNDKGMTIDSFHLIDEPPLK